MGHSAAEDAACLAASAQMLTTLVTALEHHLRGRDVPWQEVKEAILAAYGAPAIGALFRNRFPQRELMQTYGPGATWRIIGLGYSENHRVAVRLRRTSDPVGEITRCLDDLRRDFDRVEA